MGKGIDVPTTAASKTFLPPFRQTRRRTALNITGNSILPKALNHAGKVVQGLKGKKFRKEGHGLIQGTLEVESVLKLAKQLRLQPYRFLLPYTCFP